MYDPVCGMKLTRKGKFKATHNKKTYYFCDKECKNAFSKSPKKYLESTPVLEIKDVYKVSYSGKLK